MSETVTLREHLEALRQADDRRYAEVNVEKEKALKIKETADLAALQLAREIQTYKDEKANELREQINSERGLYATKDDLAAAIREVVATWQQTGKDRRQGFSTNAALFLTAAGIAVATLAIVVTVLIANGLFS
jgi:hypothetical protein